MTAGRPERARALRWRENCFPEIERLLSGPRSLHGRKPQLEEANDCHVQCVA